MPQVLNPVIRLAGTSNFNHAQEKSSLKLKLVIILPGYLEIAFVWEVGMCACVCPPPGY